MNNGIEIEEIHKEIDLIQDCIKRMENNSFMLKGWLVSLYVVVLGLLPEKFNIWLICSVLITMTISFWYLDGFFLRTEKIYRNIYEWCLIERQRGNKELLYNLNLSSFKGKIEDVGGIVNIMMSRTLKTFYLIPLSMITIVVILNILVKWCL
ncbi:hypothetical protein [Tissierella pigra]|uniref:Uncharacterized protein n=1 Tax=Tissierella pigra TaxID=2607614 RepID=A0A6N7XEE7_9FIRM|nr:hypothetical protein [Tissierella pigra]MSU00126.1 hypothetical protein [Tissierella pigra]